jgi:hypothetical protein
MARANGLLDIFFVGVQRPGQIPPESVSFNGSILHQLIPQTRHFSFRKYSFQLKTRVLRKFGLPQLIAYDRLVHDSLPQSFKKYHYPSVIHAWDNTPRSGKRGTVVTGSNPAAFRKVLQHAFEVTRGYPTESDARLVFLKSWNEWAEGNHLEPDLKYGTEFLETIKSELNTEIASFCQND